MFRGDLAHGGVYAATPIASAPTLKWSFHTGGRIVSSPAVTGQLVYVGSTDGALYAVDIATGVAKWKFKTGARVSSSPAVSNGTVYFESYDGNLYALDAATGSLKWKFASEGERRFAGKNLHGVLPKGETMPDPFDFFLSSPAVWNGGVYFGSGDGHIYALDAATGGLKWKFATDDVVHASPAIADGELFIGSWDSWFYALDAATGQLRWRFKTGEDPAIHNQVGIQSSASVANGVVYFGCRDSNLYAVEEKSGKKLWAFNNKGSWVIASPAVRDGKVYAATSDTGLFYALDARTGAQLFSINFKHWPMFSSPALAGNFAYIGSHSGQLIAIDLTKDRVAWEFETAASKSNKPAYTSADGTPNYEAAFAGNFYDDLIVGVDKLMGVGAVLSSPVVANGVIYFGSMDGNLYALAR
ncbi:MAG TPA: PQQ-binding-like beta-propeller repeat protein [Rhizomicrobium sp.]